MLVLLVGAVLISRTAGLHFHMPELHHHAHQSGAVHDHAEDPLPMPSFGLDSEHLQEHLTGARDADATATPINVKFQSALVILVLAFVGIAMLLMLRRHQLPVWAPFRPPRLRRRACLLPPSQGPPLAA
jgi:hypothetical protein